MGVKRWMNVIIALLYSISVCSTKWLNHPLNKVDIYNMSSKPFSLHDCKMKHDVNVGFIPLRPQCASNSDVKDPQYLLVTSFKAITTDIVINAVSCKKLEVRTRTFQNLVGTKTITSQQKSWKSVSNSECAKLKDKKPESTSLVANSKMYGNIHEKYQYYSHVENIDNLYFETQIKLRVDVGLNVVKSTDGTVHEGCEIKATKCNLNEGGLITWKFGSELHNETECPYERVNSELCIATENNDHGTLYLILNCPQSKTRMHLTHTTNGVLEHVQKCRLDHGIKLYETNEKAYISFNLSSSDLADLINKNLSISDTLSLYNLNRFKCETQSGVKKCTLDATNYNTTADEYRVSEMDPAFCKSGLCKLPKEYVCGERGEKIMHIIDIKYIDDISAYASSLKYDNTSFCADIMENKMVIYATATLKLKEGRSKVLLSLVRQQDQILPHSTVNGFTMTTGFSCAPSKDMLTLKGTSYREVTLSLRKLTPKNYQSYHVCSPQSGSEYMEASTGIVRATNVNDFVLTYTGKHTSGDITLSFWAEKLEFLYDTLKNGNPDDLRIKQKNLCSQQALDWAVRDSLIKMDVNSYLRTLPGRRAGYLSNNKIISWSCYKLENFKLIKRMGNNCSENIPVEYMVNGSSLQGYITQYTNEITGDHGGFRVCKNYTDFMDLGLNLLLSITNEAVSVWTQELTLHREFDYINSPPSYLGSKDEIEQDGIISRLAMIEQEQNNILNNMGFTSDNGRGLWNSSSEFKDAYNKVKTLSLRNFILSHQYVITLTGVVVCAILSALLWQTRSFWASICKCLASICGNCRRNNNRHQQLPTSEPVQPGPRDTNQLRGDRITMENDTSTNKRVVRFHREIKVDRISEP